MTRSRVKNDFAVGIDDNADATAVTIDSSENVGIGETLPSRKSHTKSTQQIVSHFESTSATRGLITVADANTTSDSYVGIGANGDDLELRAGETTKITVKDSGRVGIGNEDPDAALVVHGANGSASRIHISSSSNGLQSFVGSGSGLLLTAQNMNTSSKFTPAIQFGSKDADFTTTNPKIGAAINGVANETYSTDSKGGMDLAFYTTPNNPGTGQTTTERMRILSEGGITFNGDTAAANALDDYEEGNWTAYFTCSGTNPTISYTNTTGRYVKIGKTVYVQWYSSSMNITSAGSGYAIIQGLPFAVANTGNCFPVFTMTHTNCFSTDVQNGYWNNNTTSGIPNQRQSASAASLTTGNGVYIMVSGVYESA